MGLGKLGALACSTHAGAGNRGGPQAPTSVRPPTPAQTCRPAKAPSAHSSSRQASCRLQAAAPSRRPAGRQPPWASGRLQAAAPSHWPGGEQLPQASCQLRARPHLEQCLSCEHVGAHAQLLGRLLANQQLIAGDHLHADAHLRAERRAGRRFDGWVGKQPGRLEQQRSQAGDKPGQPQAVHACRSTGARARAQAGWGLGTHAAQPLQGVSLGTSCAASSAAARAWLPTHRVAVLNGLLCVVAGRVKQGHQAHHLPDRAASGVVCTAGQPGQGSR